MDRRRNVDVSG